MWLYRGAQSAVFYYATCTPCANSLDRRKRKKEAARSQREKEKSEAIVTDQPRPFAQPTPFSTNQGWMEEIALGPGPPKRRGGHRSNHCRTDSRDTDGLSAGSSHDLDYDGDHSSKRDRVGARHLSERWNRMLRDQREDEPLWGEEVEVKGSSIGLSGRGRIDAESQSKYYIARVPPVNDLHPPIVSGPKSRAETRWMLQPPPSARVMAGKERSPATARPPDYASRRLDSEKSNSRSTAQTRQLPPLTTQPSDKKSNPIPPASLRSPKTPEPNTNMSQPPRQLSSSFLAYGKDESNFVISPSVHSPSDSCSTLSSLCDTEMESPCMSLQSPDTPISRPVSKATNDNLQTPRPTLSKALTTVHRDNKKIHLLQLELPGSHDDIELGQLDRIRPWRWSMDI
ncbi:hypothetical protein P175DRAFT_0473967 [Aspergillus ochraceoroseus IBT 24754]|uniref:Signal peptide-containing protein n=3 Tax=Aspergillus subgen. Nidulantes TaxID=2720870 RepID=A0A0F8X9X2_9EURO|nr:uncharacterized protein P175DRAFT_0473967 [Aspergillus ochraceoroseus IBT 24754]KKK12626.1 hypothetical protein AOCH_007127 [Aspergillus ochraceoroseus]KKK26350.1 hypothetical protein ARAM_004204 [Aspergillus rambellii]PTU22662.1 hypothetical protein P175DRAFT_0473967 [Aspergillus ochraceoroseus IBT 24754]